MIDPASTQLTLSGVADQQLARLGVTIGHEGKRRALVDAAYAGDIRPIESTVERQFVADAIVAGQHVSLLCLELQGSRYGDYAKSVIVRGAFAPGEAKRLLASGKGLAPLANEVRSRGNRGGKKDDDSRAEASR